MPLPDGTPPFAPVSSLQGRARQLQTIVLGGRQHGPHLLITGGIHGDEFEPPLAIRRLASRRELSDLRGTLTLVPVVNEAAFALGQRTGEDGFDLARTCPGRPAGSVTEQAAHALTGLIQRADSYIDLHTGGTALAVWPMAGYMLHTRTDVLEKQRGLAQAFNLPLVWGTDPNLDGRSLSVARDADVPAIYAEYEGGGRCSLKGIEAYVEGCLNVMAHLGMIDRPSSPRVVQFVVEDSRPRSGHMQRCYPSPQAGCFEPSVALGQRVAIGDFLGHVSNPLTGEHCEVRSKQMGRVLALRTFPLVKLGDSLAVIVELEPGA
jgi:predicted deacylase